MFSVLEVGGFLASGRVVLLILDFRLVILALVALLRESSRAAGRV